MRHCLLVWPLLLLVGSCSSPPKPPTVDESQRRPVNSAMGLELQVCKSDLQSTRILAHESSRTAEAARAAALRLAAQQALLTKTTALESRNSVYSITFAFGSARIDVPAAETARLIAEAREAPLIMLRGRTDGASQTPAEGRIARERATAVQAYLVQAGVEPARIRATWQPAGDHAADNTSVDGRALNRRVEVEIYRTAPQLVALGGPAPQ